jgi:hypothetical protein
MSEAASTFRDSEIVSKHHPHGALIAVVALWPSAGHAISPGAIEGLGVLAIAFVVLPLASLGGAIVAAVVNHRRRTDHPYAASILAALTVLLAGALWAAVSYGRNAEHMGTIFVATLIYAAVPVSLLALITGALAASKGERRARLERKG